VERSRKKPAAVKKGRGKKIRRKGKKLSARDGLWAVLLTAALIAVSALILSIFIFIHSSVNVSPAKQDMTAGGEPEPAPELPLTALPRAEDPAVRPPPEVPVPLTPAAVRPAAPDPPSAVRPPPEVPVPLMPAAVQPAAPDPSAAVQPPPKAVRPSPTIPRRKGILVFVIDDAGNNLRELEPFLRFSGPLTIAVLPGLPHSAEAARRIRAAGKEVFLHQPMEAIGGQDPGPGALYSGRDPAAIRALLAKNMAEIGPVAGMNNHQGSRITMDQGMMETILTFCREYGIYFLDSRTTADTAASAAAGRLGIKIGERDVFIDNIQEKDSMIYYIREGLKKAERRGSAVMIGHTWSSELAAILEELYPDLIAEGYSLSTVSRMMMAGDGEQEP
jgi:polysaccharide deacetylase 2 family uncharacterized protein YibQ